MVRLQEEGRPLGVGRGVALVKVERARVVARDGDLVRLDADELAPQLNGKKGRVRSWEGPGGRWEATSFLFRAKETEQNVKKGNRKARTESEEGASPRRCRCPSCRCPRCLFTRILKL